MRARLDKRGEIRSRIDDLLQVVENKQKLSVTDVLSEGPPWAPIARPIVSATSAESRTGARPTQKTPALNSATNSPAASIARRVFPEPPGPVSVSRRAPLRSRASTSSTSRPLPTNEFAARGRFVFEIVLSGGKLPSPNW